MQCFLGQQHDSKLKVRVKYNIDVFVKSYVRKRKLYYKKQWLTYALLNSKAFNQIRQMKNMTAFEPYSLTVSSFALFLHIPISSSFCVSRLVQSCSCFEKAPLSS